MIKLSEIIQNIINELFRWVFIPHLDVIEAKVDKISADLDAIKAFLEISGDATVSQEQLKSLSDKILARTKAIEDFNSKMKHE